MLFCQTPLRHCAECALACRSSRDRKDSTEQQHVGKAEPDPVRDEETFECAEKRDERQDFG